MCYNAGIQGWTQSNSVQNVSLYRSASAQTKVVIFLLNWTIYSLIWSNRKEEADDNESVTPKKLSLILILSESNAV